MKKKGALAGRKWSELDHLEARRTRRSPPQRRNQARSIVHQEFLSSEFSVVFKLTTPPGEKRRCSRDRRVPARRRSRLRRSRQTPCRSPGGSAFWAGQTAGSDMKG